MEPPPTDPPPNVCTGVGRANSRLVSIIVVIIAMCICNATVSE